jgi:hypothetical protein
MMKRQYIFFFFFLLLAPIWAIEEIALSAQPVHLKSRSTPGFVQEELGRAIERIIRAVDPDLHVGIEVVSLKEGKKLYEKMQLNSLFLRALLS